MKFKVLVKLNGVLKVWKSFLNSFKWARKNLKDLLIVKLGRVLTSLEKHWPLKIVLNRSENLNKSDSLKQICKSETNVKEHWNILNSLKASRIRLDGSWRSLSNSKDIFNRLEMSQKSLSKSEWTLKVFQRVSVRFGIVLYEAEKMLQEF